MRKAQITIFIIIGIVLAFIVGFLFLVAEMAARQNFRDINYVEASLRAAVQQCLKSAGEDALMKIGLQGTLSPEDFFQYSSIRVYYAYNGKKSVVSLEQLQNSIATYVSRKTQECVSPILENFRKRGVKIKEKAPETEAIIAQRDVRVKLSYNLEIEVAQQLKTISGFSENFNVRLKKLRAISEKIADDEAAHPGLVNMTYLDSLDVLATIIPYDDGTKLFILEDKNSALRHLNYVYTFAIK
jgi:hypothetical protein